MIILEIPTNSQQDYQRLISVAADNPAIGFAIALNGDASALPASENVRTKIIRSRNPISMSLLRKSAAEIADTMTPKFRIIADGNFQFERPFINYLYECSSKLSEIEDRTGRPSIVGMNGSLGSGQQCEFQVPMNPMIETARGIMYSNALRSVWNQIDILPGGFEDYYFTSFAIHQFNAIPVKRFKSPIAHPRARTSEHKDFIHDRDIWKRHNLRKVRELWNDPLWTIPYRIKQLRRKGVIGEYEYKQPKNSFGYMCWLRDIVVNEFHMPELVRFGYEDKLWRKRTGAGLN